MVELYIDGCPVSLKNDLSIDYYQYNPFFTKKGEYTYDIDINLKDGDNAKIYQHINRMHIDKCPCKRRAVLIADSRVIINGTEIILSIDNDVVKIQITAGNSELNYLSAGNKTIRELDLGTIPNIDASVARNTLTKKYPDSDFVCTPVVKEKGYFDINDYVDKNDVIFNELSWDTRYGYSFKDNTTYVAQPFLLYYVDKICEKMGYSISKNVLKENEMYCRLIIVNGLETNDYRKILPDWSIDEFISEIEKLFNVIFIVNQQTRDIRILNVSSFYNNENITYVDSNNVIKNINKKYDVEDSLYITYDNVNYKLPSGTWYKYQDIDKDVLKKSTITEVDNFSNINTVEIKDQYTIIHDKSTDLYFVYNIVKGMQTTYAHLEIVDQLKGIEDETSNNKSEFKIVPSEIYGNRYFFSRGNFGGSKYYVGCISAATPTISNVASVEQQGKIYEEIEGGVSQDETESSNIFIAIYLGPTKYMYYQTYQNAEIEQPVLKNMLCPQCIVYPQFIHYSTAGGVGKLFQLAEDNYTLAIKGNSGRYKNIYNNNLTIDTKNEVIINFVTDKILDQMSVFVINNKKYYCKMLRLKIESDGINKIVEGTFYPMS